MLGWLPDRRTAWKYGLTGCLEVWLPCAAYGFPWREWELSEVPSLLAIRVGQFARAGKERPRSGP